MLTSLFRMVEPSSGTIVIDGIDITKIGLFDLRSKLSIIPQEPTLFIGTVRYNLDPFNEYTDKEIWDALDLVKLKEAVEKLPEGLWSPVSEGGSNFSVGQRQLLCMARALLKKANVLLLDEATASVDIETDSLIQKTVRKYFADCTVLTIAHRLNTIMDSTRIMVLDKGQLVEFDTPGNLIRKQDGYFRSMIEATGPASAEHLKQLAIGEISVLESIKARMKEKQKSTRQIRAKMHALARSETSASQSTAPASNTNKEKLI
jgi:ATP-binding cassette subfamily C (CFTR/MRP) protein 1